MTTDWWRNEEPIFQGESDGQQMMWVYARRLANDRIEYAVVMLSDGDGPEHTFGGVSLTDGGCVPIPPDA